MIWLYLLGNSFILLAFIWYQTIFFTISTPKKYDYLVIILMVIIKSTLNLTNTIEINLFVTILHYLYISYRLFNCTFTQRVIYTFLFIISSFIADMLAFIILDQYFIKFSFVNNLFLNKFIGISTSLLILVVFISYISKINDINELSDNNDLWYFILHPIISIIIIYSINQSDLLSAETNLSFLLIIAIIAYNLSIFSGYTKLIKSKNMQIENEKFKNNELHHTLLEEKFDNSKRFIHDYKKHINILNGYLANKDYDKLAYYLEEISNDINNNDTLIVTGNQLVDLALNANKKILLNNSIKIKYDIKIKETQPISEYDFNVVFSNIIENSIESCKKLDSSFIKIKLDRIDKIIVLKVINTCYHTNADLSTLKSENTYHGCGIEIIRKIAQKYNGKAIFNHDKNNNIFITTVIFNEII